MMLNYYGKIVPSSCAVIAMILYEQNQYSFPLYNYISTEVFNYQCMRQDPRKWFSTYPYGIDALNTGAEIIGLGSGLRSKSAVCANMEEFAALINEQLIEGSFILGPVITSALWGTVESRYFQGCTQFVMVTEQKNNNYILQDPVGCPYLVVSIKDVWKMLNNNEKIYFIQFDTRQYQPRDDDIIYYRIMKKIAENRLYLLQSSNNYIRTMCLLSDKKMKSSEKMSIQYALLYMNRAVYLLHEFTRSFLSNSGIADAGLKKRVSYLSLITEKYLQRLHVLYTDVCYSRSDSLVRTVRIQSDYEDNLNQKMEEILTYMNSQNMLVLDKE